VSSDVYQRQPQRGDGGGGDDDDDDDNDDNDDDHSVDGEWEPREQQHSGDDSCRHYCCRS
jgi:hypothetical protein